MNQSPLGVNLRPFVESSVSEVSVTEVGIVEIDVVEVGPFEVGSAEVGSAEVGAAEDGLCGPARELARVVLELGGQDGAALLAEAPPGRTHRERLNRYFTSDDRLMRALQNGTYHVGIPEEGALAVVAWLLANDAHDRAFDLLAAIEPWFDRLRFYPQLCGQPMPTGACVRVATAGEVVEKLRGKKTPLAIEVMEEALEVWAPLYDRLVALWASTVEGPAPSLDNESGVGGWPCCVWPDDWTARRAAWLADYATAAEFHE